MSHEKVFHKQVSTLIDITGQRFGHLTAVSYVKYFNGSVWLFRCDCGNSCTRRYLPLIKAVNQPSCGCAGRPSKTKHWATVCCRTARHKSVSRGRQFELSVERFGELMSKNCHYCGGAPSTPQCSLRGSAHKGLRNGIDRVDSSIGYVEGNCVPCCYKCNRMKSDHSVTDFIARISTILHHHQTCSQP